MSLINFSENNGEVTFQPYIRHIDEYGEIHTWGSKVNIDIEVRHKER